MTNPTPKVTYHAIDADYRNEFNQRVLVMTCPNLKTTIAIINSEACACETKGN